MEHHRLKPMKEGYDQKLFNQLYKKTTPLRKKLAFEIDARKFGFDYAEILAWFDIKFIYTFNKYCDTQPERLLGYIINSLQTYKYRIMRSSYQKKYHNHASMLDITELYDYGICDEKNTDAELKELQMEVIIDKLNKDLSRDAQLLLQLELNPPQYIVEQLKDIGKKETSKIPVDIIADYLGYGDLENINEYLMELRKNIRSATNNLKRFYNNNPSLVPQLS